MTLAIQVKHNTPAYPHNIAVVALPSAVILALLNGTTEGPGEWSGYVHDGQMALAIEYNPTNKPDLKVGEKYDLPFGLFVQGGAAPLIEQGQIIAVSEPMTDLIPGQALFAFDLGSRVALGTSKLSGTVRSRIDDLYGPNTYNIEYNNEHGVPADGWFREESLTELIDGDQADADSLMM